jgi:hypothetical protein
MKLNKEQIKRLEPLFYRMSKADASLNKEEFFTLLDQEIRTAEIAAFIKGAEWGSEMMFAGVGYEIDGEDYKKISDMESYQEAIMKDAPEAANQIIEKETGE